MLKKKRFYDLLVAILLGINLTLASCALNIPPPNAQDGYMVQGYTLQHLINHAAQMAIIHEFNPIQLEEKNTAGGLIIVKAQAIPDYPPMPHQARVRIQAWGSGKMFINTIDTFNTNLW